MSEQNSPIFREVQKFSSWIIVFIFSVLIFAIVIVAAAAGSERAEYGSLARFPTILALSIIACISLPLVLLFLMTRLETEVRSDGLYVRFFPFHIHYKKFTADDLSEYFARKYSPLAEYGGWGIRYGVFGAGKAYNARGSKGVQLVFKNGKRLLIGSQRPDELVNALSSVIKKP